MSKIIDSYSESNLSNSYDIYSGSVEKYGQSFISDGKPLDSCKFYLKKFGSPTGNAVAKIYAHTGTFGSGGLPTGSPLATSDNFDVSTLTTSNQLITFNFTGADKIALVNGTHYFIVLEYSGGDGTNKIQIGVDASSPTHSGNLAYYSGSWTSWTDDICFYVYGDGIFTSKSKNSSSLTNRSKNSTTLTNKSKNSTSLTNRAKNSTSLTNKAKVSTSFTNKAK